MLITMSVVVVLSIVSLLLDYLIKSRLLILIIIIIPLNQLWKCQDLHLIFLSVMQSY